MYFLMSAISCC